MEARRDSLNTQQNALVVQQQVLDVQQQALVVKWKEMEAPMNSIRVHRRRRIRLLCSR